MSSSPASRSVKSNGLHVWQFIRGVQNNKKFEFELAEKFSWFCEVIIPYTKNFKSLAYLEHFPQDTTSTGRRYQNYKVFAKVLFINIKV